LALIAALSSLASSSMRAFSFFWISLRRCLRLCASPRLTAPAARVRSSPPPVTTELESPEPSPPDSETCSGDWKYSEMPLRSPLVVEPSSHMSRKKAIMAVTKSA
jgi:hypothetical protein